MDEEILEMEDQGETAELSASSAVSSGETESILVILTTVFLVLAIGMTAFKLHSVYDFWKSKSELKKEEAKIQANIEE